MADIDTFALLRAIYGKSLSLHYDLYEKSNLHREEHGETCGVYPSSPEDASLWPTLAAVLGARRFLEVGCGLGYTAALMAEAGGPESRVDTIEGNALHADLAEAEFAERGLAQRVHVLRGEARDVLADLTDPYDVVFLDADWEEFPEWVDHLARLTRVGGVVVSANLFPLFEEWAKDMPHKEKVQAYLTKLVGDPRFRTHIIPAKWHALSFRV
ncbi:MAG: O-methyltransferase [Thermoplasmata archaeon]